MEGATIAEIGDAYDGDVLGDDPGAAYARSAAAADRGLRDRRTASGARQAVSTVPGELRLHRARLLLRQEMDKKLRGFREEADSGKKKSKAKEAEQVRRTPACTEIFANLSEYMDGRLETKTCDQMKTHIEACPACLAFIRDLKAAIDRSHKLKIPMDSETGQSLRRMLAEEYLRLLRSGEALPPR